MQTVNQSRQSVLIGFPAEPFSGSAPDLTVSEIRIEPQSPEPGGSFEATVTVENRGSAAANAGWLDLWIDRAGPVRCGDSGDVWTPIGTLAPAEVRSFSFPGLAAGAAGVKTARAFVDSACTGLEQSEQNNQATRTFGVGVPIPGDRFPWELFLPAIIGGDRP